MRGGFYGRDDQVSDMAAMGVELQSDAMLRAAGMFDSGDCLPEAELIRRTASEISSGLDVDWAEDSLLIGPERPRVTLHDLIREAHLTTRQRLAVRLMRRLGKQHLVAAEMQVQRPAISRLLVRAYLRIQAVYPELQARTPTAIGEWLWREEQALKKRQIYRRPSKHWVSVYEHQRRRRER